MVQRVGSCMVKYTNTCEVPLDLSVDSPAQTLSQPLSPSHWNLALWTSLPLAQEKKRPRKIADATSNQHPPLGRNSPGRL